MGERFCNLVYSMYFELTGFAGWNLSVVRGAIARRRFEVLRERHRAAVMIQKYARRQSVCRKYLSTKDKIVKLQSGTDLFFDITTCPMNPHMDSHLSMNPLPSLVSNCSVESQF